MLFLILQIWFSFLLLVEVSIFLFMFVFSILQVYCERLGRIFINYVFICDGLQEEQLVVIFSDFNLRKNLKE